MADLESGEEFESAESETELTEKDIQDKYPTEIKDEQKIPPPTTKESKEEEPPTNKDCTPQEHPAESGNHEGDKKEDKTEQSNEDHNVSAVHKSENDKQSEEFPPKPDTIDQQESVPQQPEAQSTGWGWGWGSIGTLLTSSVSAVSDSAHSLGKGLGSMVTNVEGALGVPHPEEMMREPLMEEEKEAKEKKVNNSSSSDDSKPKEDDKTTQNEETNASALTGVGGFLSGLTTAVQTTGMDLMSGGLDALEAIGRKTVDIISDGDPGLRKKRAALASRTTTLSSALREAKEEAEQIQDQTHRDGGPVVCALNYSILFDQYEGLVHLEALELLSKDCTNKVRAGLSIYSGLELDKRNDKLENIDKFFQEDSDEVATESEEEGSLSDIANILGDLAQRVKLEKLIRAGESARLRISQLNGAQQPVLEDVDDESSEEDHACKQQPVIAKECHDAGLHILAELSSSTIELFKKSAELILLQDIVSQDEHQLAQMYQRVTALICCEFESITTLLTDKLSNENSEEADSLITSLYLESSNSCSYIQDAFNLLQPVLQLKLMETMEKPITQAPSSANNDPQ